MFALLNITQFRLASIFNRPPFRFGVKTVENRCSGKLFFFFLLILFSFFSCQPKVLRNLSQIQAPAEIHLASMIDIDHGEERTYRASFSGFQQSMSGLLVVKKIDEDYRFVMITDFGLKVFDLSINSAGKYDFHHIMKHMDYDFLKNSLALNLLMLLPYDIDSEVEYYSNNDLLIYAPQKKMLYFVKEEKINQVYRFKGKRKVGAKASFDDQNIRIEQHQPEIRIQLKVLNHAK